MRVLVATTAGEGHFGPVVPFAIALRDAGHEVRVAAPESFEASMRRTGLDHVPVANAPPEVLGPIFSRLPSLSLEEANAMIFKEVFCGIDARSALPAMQAVADQWRPDLVLREVAEFSSLVVAERAGIPHAQVALSLNSVELTVRPLLDEPLRALGLDCGADSLATVPRLTLVPASFDDDAQTDGAAPHRFRYPLGTGSRDPIPEEWWTNRADPLIYMTFGSVTASLGFYPELYRTMLKAATDLPVRVLLTLGEADPRELEPLPTNAHVERWFPQEQVMPSAAAIVGHGGFGTTMLGLSAGVPMVAVPLFTTDQHANAHRVQSIGAGITVQLGPNAESDVREALGQIIQSGTHHAVARRIADDIAALPDTVECVTLLEKIATRR